MLDEIFAVPPVRIFPDLKRPETVAELADFARLGVADTLARLERIRRMAHEIEITPEQLKTMIDRKAGLSAEASAEEEGIILLDVREDWEYETCKIAGSLRLGDFRLEDLMPRLQAAAAVITICHHGVRSFSAAMYLRDHGVPGARSLEGGVEAWAEEIDRAMARY